MDTLVHTSDGKLESNNPWRKGRKVRRRKSAESEGYITIRDQDTAIVNSDKKCLTGKQGFSPITTESGTVCLQLADGSCFHAYKYTLEFID